MKTITNLVTQPNGLLCRIIKMWLHNGDTTKWANGVWGAPWPNSTLAGRTLMFESSNGLLTDFELGGGDAAKMNMNEKEFVALTNDFLATWEESEGESRHADGRLMGPPARLDANGITMARLIFT